MARIFLPLLVVILVADVISGEATDGTIKLLLIRPVSRAKILLGKWLVSLFSTFIWSLVLCAALLVTAFAIMGTRGGNQPIVTNVYYTVEQVVQDNGMPSTPMLVTHYDHAVVMAQWQFLFTGFLYTALGHDGGGNHRNAVLHYIQIGHGEYGGRNGLRHCGLYRRADGQT